MYVGSSYNSIEGILWKEQQVEEKNKNKIENIAEMKKRLEGNDPNDIQRSFENFWQEEEICSDVALVVKILAVSDTAEKLNIGLDTLLALLPLEERQSYLKNLQEKLVASSNQNLQLDQNEVSEILETKLSEVHMTQGLAEISAKKPMSERQVEVVTKMKICLQQCNLDDIRNVFRFFWKNLEEFSIYEPGPLPPLLDAIDTVEKLEVVLDTMPQSLPPEKKQAYLKMLSKGHLYNQFGYHQTFNIKLDPESITEVFKRKFNITIEW